MKFIFYVGMTLVLLLNSLNALSSEGLYFKTRQGEEIRLSPSYVNGELDSISFETFCYSNNGYCTTYAHTSDIMEAFVDSVLNDKLYTYRYVPYDPCMDPRNGCVPHGVEPAESDVSSASASQRAVEAPSRNYRRQRSEAPQQEKGPVGTMLNSAAQEFGTQAVRALSEHLMKKNGTSTIPKMLVQAYKKSGGREIPWTVCEVKEHGCITDEDVDILVIPPNKVKVKYSAEVNTRQQHERLFALDNSFRKFFGNSDYVCTFGYTGTLPDLQRQVVCQWVP
ncbi:hypothetical protein [Pseudoalteromonas rubra]|uniref:Uncharacterized protein n=1 Tax=Pseudoalteromonas rubra TaxID=43658 RepID=A0A0U3II25_9GAMM|nr:hypothetical protein [Pseudoalteromonas rubra]ALU42988.1 hypothetical protein AT705_08540 [Pseudoalteromonas rubra]